VRASASYNYLKLDGSSLLNSEASNFWMVGLGMQWNIWDWWKTSSNITIEGINIKYSRGLGIEIINGNNNLIKNCTIANLGIVAVSVGRFTPNLGSEIYDNTLYNPDAGNNNGVTGCTIYNTGEGGVILGGGDRKTLTRGNNFVENCLIHNTMRISRTYRAGVYMYGVGNKVLNNEIYEDDQTKRG